MRSYEFSCRWNAQNRLPDSKLESNYMVSDITGTDFWSSKFSPLNITLGYVFLKFANSDAKYSLSPTHRLPRSNWSNLLYTNLSLFSS